VKIERFKAGLANDETTLWGEDTSGSSRYYYDQEVGGRLVAVAISSDGFVNFTDYYCLAHVWYQQSDTFWISEEGLLEITEELENA
jgi:hypothetical protein